MGEYISGEQVYRRSRLVQVGTLPAAGADWSVKVPGGHAWRLISAYAELTTDANAASRLPRLQLNDGVAVFLDIPPNNGQQASLTHRYAWLVHGNSYQAQVGTPQTLIAGAVSGAATGTALSYTVPTGTAVQLSGATFHLIGGTAPTVQLQLVRGATTVVLWSGTADTQLTLDVPLQAADVIRWQVTATGAGSTIDVTLSGEPSSLAGVAEGEVIGLPELVLDAGSTIAVATDGLQVGDQWTAPRLLVLDATVRSGPIDLEEAAATTVVVIGAAQG